LSTESNGVSYQYTVTFLLLYYPRDLILFFHLVCLLCSAYCSL
jgi:hypothetical protein